MAWENNVIDGESIRIRSTKKNLKGAPTSKTLKFVYTANHKFGTTEKVGLVSESALPGVLVTFSM